MISIYLVLATVILSIVDNTIYLYYTEDGLSVEFRDCIYHRNLHYCRRPPTPVSLERDNRMEECYHNGIAHSFISLLLNNISVNTVLHQWKSSVERAEQYSRYIKQEIKSVDDNKKYLCECIQPESFGKNCEYLLPIENSTFATTIDWEFQLKSVNEEQVQISGDIICYTTLTCSFGLLCLDWRDICDGVQQCMFGNDEENCDRLEFNECENDEYRCMNGMCIPDEYFLDGDYDCMDMTDEKHLFNDIICTFEQVNLECDDRLCLPNEWSCGDGQCIKNRLAFQQILTVNHQCNSRRDQFYMCETGAINKRWTLPNGKCDGSRQYQEFNVQNRNRYQLCIYYFKCLLTDGAEKNCPCRFYGTCTKYVHDWCGVFYSFPDGNILAPYADNKYFSETRKFQVLPHIVHLNGAIKCRGYLVKIYKIMLYPSRFNLRDFEAYLCEEPNEMVALIGKGYDLNCHNDSFTTNNRSYNFIDVCKNSKECISAYRINDGIKNCLDEMDENQNESIVINVCSHINRHRFRCSIDEPTCLFVNVLGDKKFDCSNKYDEAWMGTNILLSEMTCNRESKKDCQLIRQYIEASWNSDIILLKQKSTTNIPFPRFCDTFYDLGSRNDENANICRKWWKCLDEQWQCRTGQCIDVMWVLDGQWDCNDASDEENLFAFNDSILIRNLKLIDISILIKKFTFLQSKLPFNTLCNLSIEYPCFRVDTPNSLVNIINNRPCINLQQIGDGHIDCIGGRDERNTIRHCTESTTLGNDFLCISSGICLNDDTICDPGCPNPSDRHILCHNSKDSFNDCSTNRFCIDGTCITTACNSKKSCAFGEERYMCNDIAVAPLGMISRPKYRKEKELTTKNVEHKLELRQFPVGINRIKKTVVTSSSLSTTTTNIHSLISINSSLPYVCNRGVGIVTSKNLVACFCPPQYYGIKCEYHNDRVTVILHLNLSQSIYAEITDLNLIIKLFVIFLFENETVSTREFHVRPAIERIIYKKMIHHFLYSRSNRSLINKQIRYFNRSKILNEHPYAIRIESYEIKMNKKPQLIAIWQYPIYFDYLPSFRLSKILKLMKSDDRNNPCSSNPCAQTEECHQLQNQRSNYVCICPNNFTGTNCTMLNQMCSSDFCSSHSLCKANYRSLLNGNDIPYCICPWNTFGRRCHLTYDSCIENPCRNNGTCLTTENINEFLCICNNRYYGMLCELEKQTVQLYFNGSIIHTGVVIQYFRLNFLTLDLILVGQRVFNSLPNSLFTFHDNETFPEIILIKFYSNKQINIHLILLQFNVISINETIQLTNKDHYECMSINILWSITEDIFPIKYHHLCINNSRLLCFYDEEYLCICSENNNRVECFGYDHNLEQCSRCLVGGQCLQEDYLRKYDFICLCPKCYRGSLCQFNTEIQSFSIDSIFSEINFEISLLYLILTILIFIIGAINNYASFITFKRSKIRQVGVGKYLLVVSILNQCSLFALFGKILQIFLQIFLNNISCKILSYMLSVFTRCSFWLLSWITIERLFVVIFPFGNRWKKTYFSLITIFITFIFVGSMHIHDLVFYIAVEDINKKMICVANFTENFSAYNRITVIIHYVLPFFIQIISITILIILTARNRSRVNKINNRTFIEIFKEQLSTQKELYITPLIMILSSLPQVIFAFIYACTELSMSQQHLLISAYFLSYAPQLLGFVLFVIPSTIYLDEFRNTRLAKNYLYKILLPIK